jgi:hypothetical protein
MPLQGHFIPPKCAGRPPFRLILREADYSSTEPPPLETAAWVGALECSPGRMVSVWHLLLEKSQLSLGAQGVSGDAIAERLGKDGASVVVNYVRNADKSREVVSAIEAREGAHSPCGPT